MMIEETQVLASGAILHNGLMGYHCLGMVNEERVNLPSSASTIRRYYVTIALDCMV